MNAVFIDIPNTYTNFLYKCLIIECYKYLLSTIFIVMDPGHYIPNV